MIKCKVIEKFSLKDFYKLKNIERVSLDTEGKLYVGDQFECDQKMADYLTGNNVLKKTVVKIVEVEPEEVVKAVEPEIIIDEEKVKDIVLEKPKKKKRK